MDETGEPVGRYRARLAPEPRFELPLRLPASEHTVPEVELEYLPPEAPPQLRSEVGLPLPPPTVTVAEELLPGAVKKQSAALTPKPASPELGREALPDPTGRLFTDTSTAESMELLRFVDMARADRYRAAVMADPHSRREVQGYVNFTMLRLDGRLFEIPASHPIYHSFYEYENGFPGELKHPVPREAGHRWRYPERPPDAVETRGLWGVELHGDLVAAISDLDLHRQWAGTTQSERDPGEGEGEGREAVGAVRGSSRSSADERGLDGLRR